jgi:hypothetical protein
MEYLKIGYERYDTGDHPSIQLFSYLEKSLMDTCISEVDTTLVSSDNRSCLTADYLYR